MLWLMGGDDLEAPNEVSLAFLRRLEAEGRPVQTILYPGADHGILLFRTNPQGERIYTRVAPTYDRDRIDWIRRQCSLGRETSTMELRTVNTRRLP